MFASCDRVLKKKSGQEEEGRKETRGHRIHKREKREEKKLQSDLPDSMPILRSGAGMKSR